MTTPSLAPIDLWLCEPLPKEAAVTLERLRAAPDVRRIAVMPDVHVAGPFCVGTVLATAERIYPQAVGGDIGCGMTALRFDADASVLEDERVARTILADLATAIPTNKHRSASVPDGLPDGLEQEPLSDPALESVRRREGRYQLGTLGRGNHFVELQADDEERLWLMVHSGSRGIGQAISDFHGRNAHQAAARLWSLPADGPGAAYVHDAAWAERYAAANRLVMARAVEAVLRKALGIEADWSTLVDSSHNHVRREMHDGVELWVHRKGALPAEEGVAGVIPGSMGTRSFHVVGRGCAAALCSSSHGAGRSRTRTEARQTIGGRQVERELRNVWFDPRMMEALREEAPSAYKEIGKVMKAQRELTRIVRELRPLLAYKGR